MYLHIGCNFPYKIFPLTNKMQTNIAAVVHLIIAIYFQYCNTNIGYLCSYKTWFWICQKQRGFEPSTHFFCNILLSIRQMILRECAPPCGGKKINLLYSED